MKTAVHTVRVALDLTKEQEELLREMLQLRTQAGQIERRLTEALTKHPALIGVSGIMRPMSVSYGPPPSLNIELPQNVGYRAIGVVEFHSEVKSQAAPFPQKINLDPATLNLLLNSKILNEAEKRALLQAQAPGLAEILKPAPEADPDFEDLPPPSPLAALEASFGSSGHATGEAMPFTAEAFAATGAAITPPYGSDKGGAL